MFHPDKWNNLKIPLGEGNEKIKSISNTYIDLKRQ